MGSHFLFPLTALFLLLLICFVGSVTGGELFSKLPQTLIVTASPKQGQVLIAGESSIKISWGLNQTKAVGSDTSAYKKVKVKLCYAPVSQQNRGWRKTEDDIKKDKTCQFTIATQPLTKNTTTGYDYILERFLPTATYFVRAYVLDSGDKEVAYGQNTDAQRGTNLFEIVGISGRHASLDIAAACFSAFAVLSLAFFFVKEKRMRKL